MTREIRAFKLVTGEEVIASAEKVELGWELEKPFVVKMIPTPNGLAPIMGQWLITATATSFFVPHRLVILDFEPGTDVMDVYIRQTTNIQIAR